MAITDFLPKKDGNFEALKEKFEARTQEIVQSFENLKVRREEVKVELEKAENKSNSVSAAKLFSGKLKDVTTTYDELKEELEAIDEFVENTKKLGGVAAICKTDEELAKLANQLNKELDKYLKQTLSKKQDMEKRYEKLLAEVSQIENERLALEDDYTKTRNLMDLIERRTNVAPDRSLAHQAYTFKDLRRYAEFRGIKHKMQYHGNDF